MSSWEIWDTSTWTTNIPDAALWKGKNGSTTNNSLVNCYIAVDHDFTMNQNFLVSGSGGNHSNMNFTLDGTSITFGEAAGTMPFNFNDYSDTVSFALGFYFNAATSSTGTVNFNNTATTFDLYTVDKIVGGASIKKFGRVISFGEGITANFAGNLTVSGRNSALTVSDSLFSVAGNLNVAGTLFLNTTIANFSGAVRANAIELSGTKLTLSSALAPKTASSVDVHFTGGTNDVTVAHSSDFSNSAITVDAGATVNIVATTPKQFDIYKASTIKGTLNIAAGSHSSNPSSYIRANTVVDGGLLTDSSSSAAYALMPLHATLTLQNSAIARTTSGSGGIGVAAGGVTTVDETSALDTNWLVFYSGGEGGVAANLYLSSAANLAKTPQILVNAKGTNAGDLLTGKIHLTADESAYQFSTIQFLRRTNLDVYLNGASVEFGGVSNYGGKACTSVLTFYEFLNGTVKLGIDESIIAASGVITLPTAGASLTVKGYAPGSETLLDGDWGIDAGGYLWNSAASYIPEPAEWASLFGLIALALAAYRRRKAG